MVSGWPIRKKLTIGIALLLVSLAILAIGGILGSHSYRSLIRGINRRVPEIPLTNALAQNTSALLATVKPLESSAYLNDESDFGNLIPGDWLIWEEFDLHLGNVQGKLAEYRKLLDSNSEIAHRMGNVADELATAVRMQESVQKILVVTKDGWYQTPELQHQVILEVKELHQLAGKLPKFLADRMSSFSDDVRVQYRTWIVSTWITSCTALTLLLLIIRLFYAWVFAPLGQLIQGSRRVAGGDFDFRIRVESKDEIAELGNAMNDMTQRFQEIRDDLDGQVRQRTTEVVRSEQLASVGFLAAGVAHEINNPLASIAWSAESLEERINEIVSSLESHEDHDFESVVETYEVQVIRDYLKMIQDEAFRCKEITERLLDFSRLGDVEKQTSNLTELVQGVIDMVRHVGKYREKQVVFDETDPVYVPMNSQEIKQVVLNLITNGLDSLDPGGSVTVAINVGSDNAYLAVADNGCGMSAEVKEHLFEPFFTRRRDGQGTGLGMSISYRIINDHGGDLNAHSDGPGRGSTFTVKLPLKSKDASQKFKIRHNAA